MKQSFCREPELAKGWGQIVHPLVVTNAWRPSEREFRQSGRNVPHHPVHPFLGLWEHFHNPDFNYIEFEAIETEAGLNSFVLTPKRWVEQTAAKGIVTKQGRYAATFAHQDIAFEFASWISPEFKLYIVKDYQRLKSEENSRLSLGWNLNRELTKINYKIHTDAIKEHLVPDDISTRAQSFIYANEADVFSVKWGALSQSQTFQMTILGFRAYL